VDESGVLVVTGEVPAMPTMVYAVSWPRGVRVRAAPSLRAPVLGHLEQGDRFHGCVPEEGWVRLAGGEGFVLLDGSALGLPALLQPLRRVPARATPFVRKLRLPADADLDTASASHQDETLTITLPKLTARALPKPATASSSSMAATERPKRPAAATAPPARVDPAPPKRPAAATAPPARVDVAPRASVNQTTASTEPPSRPATAPPAPELSRKRQAPAAHGSPGSMDVGAPAAARPAAAARPPVPLVPGSTADPLLAEAAPAAANVQSPAEACEEWCAMECGGFAPASAPLAAPLDDISMF